MEDKKKARTISIQVTPENKEKAVWLVRQSCRSLSVGLRPPAPSGPHPGL